MFTHSPFSLLEAAAVLSPIDCTLITGFCFSKSVDPDWPLEFSDLDDFRQLDIVPIGFSKNSLLCSSGVGDGNSGMGDASSPRGFSLSSSDVLRSCSSFASSSRRRRRRRFKRNATATKITRTATPARTPPTMTPVLCLCGVGVDVGVLVGLAGGVKARI
jgi:hypothetical protein